MALKDVLDALRGYGEGATMGAIRYPQALLYSQVMNVPYEQALQEVAAQRRAAEDSAAYKLANLGGGLATGLATGGGALPAVIARQAGLGAIGGFTSQDGMDNALEDTLTGAGIGGALGSLGGVVDKGQKAAQVALRRYYGRDPQVIETTLREASKKLKEADKAFFENPTVKKLYDELVEVKPVKVKTSTGTRKMVRASEGTPAAKAAIEQEAKDALYSLALKADNPLGLDETARATARSIRSLKGQPKLIERNIREGTFAPGRTPLMNALREDVKGALPIGAAGVAGLGLGELGMLPEGISGGDAALGAMMLTAPFQLGRLKARGLGMGAAAAPRGLGSRATGAVTGAVPTGMREYNSRELDALEAQYDVDELDALEAEYDKD